MIDNKKAFEAIRKFRVYQPGTEYSAELMILQNVEQKKTCYSRYSVM